MSERADKPAGATKGVELRPHLPPAGDCYSYKVYLGGVLIGWVESYRTESWRKVGRLRTTMIGRPKSWRASLNQQGDFPKSLTTTAHTRRVAVQRLVDAYMGNL